MKTILVNKLTLSQLYFFSLTTSILLTLFSIYIPVGKAEYIPPEGPPPSGQTVANGTRTNCDSISEIPLTSLAPTNHVGRTTTTKPTLAWFVAVTNPYRISLTLYNLTTEKSPILIKQIEKVENNNGIIELTLPEDEPVLKVGERYLWQVALACTPDSPMYDQSFVAELEVTEVPVALAEEIAVVKTPLEKAEIYAQAGYWYDALREALIVAKESNSQDKTVSSLLNDLADLEDAKTNNEGSHSWYLRKIANHFNEIK